MIPILESLNLRDAGAVTDALRAGAAANRGNRFRRGCVEVVDGRGETGGKPARLVATGDLHDNPLHMARVLRAAGMDGPSPSDAAHVTLHELIHPDRLTGGLDFSYRALVRAAALKSAFPARVHTLLANHELAQVAGAGIVKDGVRVVDAFNDGVAAVFGDDAAPVQDAIGEFIRSMPLALRCAGAGEGGRDLLCSHSLPAPELMDRFDPGVLDRELTDEDFVPRRGAAHLMVWGREWRADQAELLAAKWGVGTFVLGHEKAENGWFVPAGAPRVVVLNSDHERGVIAELELSRAWTAEQVGQATRPLAAVGE